MRKPTAQRYSSAACIAYTIAIVFAMAIAMAGCSKPVRRPVQIIPLDLSGPHPTTQLTINKHPPVTVIFDSGAGSSVLDKSLAQTLGLPDRGSVDIGSPGANVRVTGFMTEIASARVGEADLEGARTVAMDLPDRLKDVSGIVSPYAFAGRLVRFEFARSRAIVVDKTKANLPTGASHPYGGERGHLLPAIEVDVVGIKLNALLDSGSKYGLQLPLEYAKRVPLRAALVPMEPVQMIGGTHAVFSARVAGTVHIGSLTLSDPEIQFVEGVPIANVGILVLKSATLVLDPEDERSWLLPASLPLDPAKGESP